MQVLRDNSRSEIQRRKSLKSLQRAYAPRPSLQSPRASDCVQVTYRVTLTQVGTARAVCVADSLARYLIVATSR